MSELKEIKELSKEQKLTLIDAILEKWKAKDEEEYICFTVCDQALRKHWISLDTYCSNDDEYLCTHLIPELLQIKPVSEYVHTAGWFGGRKTFGNIRTQKLLELKEIIEKNTKIKIPMNNPDKHFKFTDEFKMTESGVKLFRIQCIKEIPGTVAVGDLGGWVESYENINDSAWVFDDAAVYNDARIYNNVRIRNEACVFDRARIFNNVEIRDNVQVFNDAHIHNIVCIGDHARIYGNVMIGDNVFIGGRSKIYGNAQIFGDAHINQDVEIFDDACIRDNARITNNAKVFDCATILDNAHVGDNAQIYGTATVFNCAYIYQEAHIFDHCTVDGNSKIRGHARIGGTAHVTGGAVIENDAEIFNKNDYCCFQSFGSNGRGTTVFRLKNKTLRIICGCFSGTLDEFEEAVEDTHGDGKFGREYKAIIQVIKVKFNLV
jgi:carbonic anhydrase/acetyltransferase-like protein (isoleucine patch superfamily)